MDVLGATPSVTAGGLLRCVAAYRHHVLDRRFDADVRGMHVARTYEEVMRGATVVDVSRGDVDATNAILSVFRSGGRNEPPRVSADLISRSGTEVRLIEVKARGSSGPRNVPERELDTMGAAGDLCWLYAIDNTTQPYPIRLTIVRNPAALPWELVRGAERESGTARGVRHEARFSVSAEAIAEAGSVVDLTSLQWPSWAGASRD